MCISICQKTVQVMRENWQTSMVGKIVLNLSGSAIVWENSDKSNNNIVGAPNVEEINYDCLTEKHLHLNLRRLLTDLTFLYFLACHAYFYHFPSLVIKHISIKCHWANRVEIGACSFDLRLFGAYAKNFLSREFNMYLLWKNNICKNNLFGQNYISKQSSNSKYSTYVFTDIM